VKLLAAFALVASLPGLFLGRDVAACSVFTSAVAVTVLARRGSPP
jgi:hypothetical protein